MFNLRHPLISRLVCVVAAIVLAASYIQPQLASAQMTQSSQPRLVLLLVVDQFSYGYLSRFADKLSPGGFRYLIEHGALFTNCRYKQATTQTAVGHSVISTGAYPWSTGIIGNSWYDRRRGAEIEAVTDENVQQVGASGSGVSCRAMAGTTIGDELRLSTNGRSRVISLSLKDRAALFLGGKMANGAYWFDDQSGTFVTGSQFGAIPAWLKLFNDQRYADKFFNKQWLKLLPESEYSASTRDEYLYEGALPGGSKTFPHTLNGGLSSPGQMFYQSFLVTPFANQMVADAAKEAIQSESLGGDSDADLLAISFSSTDYIGHVFGPASQEAQDAFIRLDQTIANLLQYVNAKVGLDKCVIAVTGDHGVMPIPEMLKDRSAGRMLDAGRVDPKAFKTLLDSILDSRLGPQDWITEFSPPNLYLNLAAIDKEKYRQPEVEALAAKMARSVPGIGDVYYAAQLFGNQLPSGPHTDSVRRSYCWGRSGELYVMPKPGWIFDGDQIGTSHGSPYAYDSQVPLILCGTQVQSGAKLGYESSPADIAPTLCSILTIPMPSLCEGRVLQEALGQVFGPPGPLPGAGQSRSGTLPLR